MANLLFKSKYTFYTFHSGTTKNTAQITKFLSSVRNFFCADRRDRPAASVTLSIFAAGGAHRSRPPPRGGPQGPRPRHSLVSAQRQCYRQRFRGLRGQSVAHPRRGPAQDAHRAHSGSRLPPEEGGIGTVAPYSLERVAHCWQRQPGGHLERRSVDFWMWKAIRLRFGD